MKFQTLKPIASLMFLMSTICLLLFMNCQIADSPIVQDSSSGPDTTSDPTTPLPQIYTNPNPPSGPPDPTPRPDPNNPNAPPTSNIVWLHTDVSSWAETSQITDVKIQENGQICIYHSKSGQWDARFNVDSAITEPVEGNAWVIVPINNKYYAATYDYLRESKPCHTLDAESITNLYHSDKSLGKRTDRVPLDRWVPLAGDTIAFMVSGLARNEKRNVQERSNIIRVTLPSADGVDSTIVHPPCSEDPTGPLCSIESCNIPNRGSIVRNMANEYSEAFLKAHQLNLDRVNNGPKSQSSDDPRWEFMDRVVQRLYKTDRSWGYTCVRKDCDDISTDAIAYQCDEQSTTPTSSHVISHDVTAIDIINANGSAQWSVHREIEEPKDVPGWKYPRPGATNYEEDQNPCHTPGHFCYEQGQIIRQAINNICSSGQINNQSVPSFSWDKTHLLNGGVIQNTDIQNWKETSSINSVEINKYGICLRHTQERAWKDGRYQGTLFTFIPRGGSIYIREFDFINGEEIPGCSHHPWVWQIDDQIPFSIKEAIIKYVGGLKAIWLGGSAQDAARTPIRDWFPIPGDILGFAVSSNTEKKIKKERSDIVWVRIPNYCSVSSGGEIVGRFSTHQSDCTPEELADGFQTVDGKCVPLCPRLNFYTTDNPPQKLTGQSNFDVEDEEEIYDLYGDILKHIETVPNQFCADDKKAEYNILKIDKPVAGVDVCCRISKKTECPQHYELKTINGERNCYPNCGQAAEFAGYGGYGLDGQSRTSDDPHVYFPNNTTACQSQSTAFGGGWKEMPSFYDPYRFKTLTANEAQSLFTGQSSRCCVRGQPTNTSALPHNDEGTYTTATTTTTTPHSNSNNGQGNSRNNKGSGDYGGNNPCNLGEGGIEEECFEQ